MTFLSFLGGLNSIVPRPFGVIFGTERRDELDVRSLYFKDRHRRGNAFNSRTSGRKYSRHQSSRYRDSGALNSSSEQQRGALPFQHHSSAGHSPIGHRKDPLSFFIFGLGGDDRLRGGEAADFIFGGRGNDQLFGFGGDDFLYGGTGYDYLKGGTGFDTVSYSLFSKPARLRYALTPLPFGSTSPQKVRAELQLQMPRKVDILEEMERIIAPMGVDSPNQINFSDMHIRSDAYVGDNTAEAGDRSVVGPRSRVSPQIDIDLGAQLLSFEEKVPEYVDPSGLQKQQLKIENFQNVLGSYGRDVIRGDAQANSLDGFFGDDWIMGGAGDDVLVGNGGDMLIGGPGRDTFRLEAAWASVVAPDGTTTVQPLQTRVFDFEEGVDRLRLVRRNNTVLPLFQTDSAGWVGEDDLGGGLDNDRSQAQSRIELQGFSDLPVGSLTTETFRLIGDPSEIPADITGVFYNPNDGALYYQGTSVPESLRPLQVATIMGLRQPEMMVLSKE